MTSDTKLTLAAFVQVASPDTLRIIHRDTAWWVRSGDVVLQRPCGSTAFSSISEVFEVLAGVGIRCAVVEWDGVISRSDKGRAVSDRHVLDAAPKH